MEKCCASLGLIHVDDQCVFFHRSYPTSSECAAQARDELAEPLKEDYFHSMDNNLRILPLGGFDQVGANAVVYETDNDFILVDCGVAFPATDLLGVRALSPNPDYIKSRIISFAAISSPMVMRTISVPSSTGVSLSPDQSMPQLWLKSCLRRRYEEREEELLDFNEIKAGVTLSIGDFDIEAIHVTHSIPESLAFSIEACGLRVMHTGDFKLDQTPISGRPTDLSRLREIGELGVDALIADSTNATRAGRTPSEAEVAETLREVIAKAQQRVVLTTFPTNLERVRSTIDAAIESGRMVVALGRSAEKMIEIGLELGYLPEDAPLASRHELQELGPGKTACDCGRVPSRSTKHNESNCRQRNTQSSR